MSNELQTLKEATKRKSNGLFFIKSKHVRPTFKNHSYFEMKPKNNIISESNNKNVELSQNKILSRWKMFVHEPSGYGIDNTFRYMCDQIRLSKQRETILQNIEKDRKNSKGYQEGQLPKRYRSQSKKRFATEQSLPSDQYNKTINYDSNSRLVQFIKIKENMRSTTQTPIKYLENTQCFNYRIRKSKHNSLHQPQNQQKTLQQNHTSNQNQAKHIIEMTYVFGGRESLYFDSETENKISFNILPYILSCFFKCKINYSKHLTQTQYNLICSSIEQIKGTAKQPFDVKDIICLSTVKEVLDMLQVYGHGCLEWAQTIRYFFMPTSQVLTYQYKKLIDEIKIMTILKFNIQLIDQQLYIYRVQDKLRVANIYDLLKPGTYIYSESKAVYENYCRIQKRKAQIFSYNNRIKRWRSVAPLDEHEIEKFRKGVNGEDGKMSIEKYHKLFEMTRKKRSRNLSAKYSIGNRTRTLTSSPGNLTFIDKSKLNHSQDIFE